MLKFLKWVVYLVMAFVVLVLLGSFLLPSTVVVKRSIAIAAPPEKVFALVGDLKRFPEFSPWADLDPNIKVSFEGPAIGVGQTMRWSSYKREVGSGVQTITDYKPATHVASSLAFEGMSGSTAAWDLEPQAAGTVATWSLSAELHGVVERWFGLMFDRWIGADYEKGLARLKILAEAPEPAAPALAPDASAPAPTPAAEPAPAPADQASPVKPQGTMAPQGGTMAPMKPANQMAPATPAQ